jgi:hypothetical protein
LEAYLPTATSLRFFEAQVGWVLIPCLLLCLAVVLAYLPLTNAIPVMMQFMYVFFGLCEHLAQAQPLSSVTHAI